MNQEAENQEVNDTSVNMQDGEGVDSAILAEASELGWKPLEDFRGDPAKWVDAGEFVERGRHIMPILKKNNESLRADLLKRDSEIDILRNNLSAMNQTVERLETFYNEGTKRALKAQEIALRKQLIEARQDSDVELEISLQSQIDDVREAQAREQVKPAKIDSPQGDGLSPEFKQWKDANPWFGVDHKKTRALIRAAEDLRDEGEATKGAAFFELAAARAFKPSTPGSKVEAGNARGNGLSGGQGKGFGSLPKDAQDACMQDVDMFVGRGKKFKEVKDWQAYYAKVYHGEPV